jgi:hypothetical protein
LGLWWKRWREVRREAAAVYPTLVAAVGLGMLTMAATQRELYMIPLLIPLTVLAAQGHDDLPPWLGRMLGQFPL